MTITMNLAVTCGGLGKPKMHFNYIQEDLQQILPCKCEIDIIIDNFYYMFSFEGQGVFSYFLSLFK